MLILITHKTRTLIAESRFSHGPQAMLAIPSLELWIRDLWYLDLVLVTVYCLHVSARTVFFQKNPISQERFAFLNACSGKNVQTASTLEPKSRSHKSRIHNPIIITLVTVDARETSFDADKCLLVNVHINLEKCDFYMYMQVYAFGYERGEGV